MFPAYALYDSSDAPAISKAFGFACADAEFVAAHQQTYRPANCNAMAPGKFGGTLETIAFCRVLCSTASHGQTGPGFTGTTEFGIFS